MNKKNIIINIIFAVTVMASALFVRTPSGYLVDLSDESRAVYSDDTNLPYFTDMDSYYHVRLVDRWLESGMIGDTVNDEGIPWDMHSFYPEGRSAAYQPGIVWLTVAAWRLVSLFGPIDIMRVEFFLPAIMSMLTALAAYIAGVRVNGKLCGFVAGILAGCGPVYVSRSGFGRFDTDMFVVLMNVLLILFIIETLRASKLYKKLIFAGVFLLTAIMYSYCWAPRYSMLFAGLAVLGGVIFAAIVPLLEGKWQGIREYGASLVKGRDILILAGTGVLVLFIVGITQGFDVVGRIFTSLFFSTTSDVTEGSIPNLFVSVAELKQAKFAPDTFGKWFVGYLSNSAQTVVTGIGGFFAFMAAIGGLAVTLIRSLGKLSVKRDELPGERICLVYFIVLGLWFTAGLFLTRSGVRFIEMVSPPAAVLAGIFLGWLSRRLRAMERLKVWIGVLISVIVTGAVTIPAWGGGLLASAANSPSASDASYNAMKWIRENAEDPDAVIESWWDMGYYYESESGHPCIWDGGSQDGVRAVLFSRAMTDGDLEQSNRILKMLACSGNRAVELMMEYTDPRTAFDALWEALPLDGEKAAAVIEKKCSMPADKAKEAESLIHPVDKKEAYLVITYTMTKQIGWYEYYSDWDFTGTQQVPEATWYSFLPDGTPAFDTEEGQEYLQERRAGETMWRLFFNAEENPYFVPQYEWHDGTEHVRIWKITS